MAAALLAGLTVDCVSCGEAFGPAHEMFLGVVRYSAPTPEGVQEFDIYAEDDLRYEPVLLDPTCWNEVHEGLHDVIENHPPLRHPEQLLSCSFCTSSILALEYYARIKVGDLCVSPRHPGSAVLGFDDNNLQGLVMCLSCMAYVTDEVLDIWDNVMQQGECADCQHARCWRENQCPLACACHDEAEEEDEDEEEEELYERGDAVRYKTPNAYAGDPEGVVLRDQEDDEDEVDVRWSNGDINQTHIDHLIRA